MQDIFYSAALVPVRDDFAAAHTRFWKRLASPGAWWTGAERVAIAAEVRQARHCAGRRLGAHDPCGGLACWHRGIAERRFSLLVGAQSAVTNGAMGVGGSLPVTLSHHFVMEKRPSLWQDRHSL